MGLPKQRASERAERRHGAQNGAARGSNSGTADGPVALIGTAGTEQQRGPHDRQSKGGSGNHRSSPNSRNREPSSTQGAKILAERKSRTSSRKGWVIRWSKRCASEAAGKLNPASIACGLI